MKKETTTLGLDIGANSIGWALIREIDGNPASITATGVRIFEEGVNLDAKSGKTESRNVKRREARLRRRQVARHALRKRRVHRLLAEAGLLPPGQPQHTDPAWKSLLDLDPYQLRAKGLDVALGPSEFGRVIYHLAERRGFLSNRKRPVKDDEHGKVKDGIKRLDAEWKASKARTIGEYFSRLNPHEVRIRTHYTLRDWFKQEFDLLWSEQQKHHPQLLTEALKSSIRDALFNQRPLLIRSAMLGKCELEPGRRRAPMALLHVQEFRLLQEINHLRIEDGTPAGKALPEDARESILALLSTQRQVTFGKIRTSIPGLKKCRFNLERGDRKNLEGNSTAAALRGALGEKWDRMEDASRRRLVNDLISIENEEILCARLSDHWKFSRDEIELIINHPLEEGHAALSSAAIFKILPHLRMGKSYREAVDSVEWAVKPDALQELLPPLEDLRNPIVQRALAETRRVVNAVIKRYGKPSLIRVELARELKLNRDDRAEYITGMRRREKERNDARQELISNGLRDPKSRDIEKWLLLKECNSKCPYTGAQISFASLFQDAEFDIEHILPFSRSFDDSFANKTLCHVKANRIDKRDQTPFEVYGGTPKYDEIIKRVEAFNGPFAEAKLRRFKEQNLATSEIFAETFTQRQLNDTKYASARAARYLRCLYPENQRLSAVQVSTGRVTAYLRNAWDLNRILGDGPRKSRDDHRHHAVDAVCVALTSPGIVHALSRAAARWNRRGGRDGVFRDVPAPWPSFYKDVEASIRGIVVSHRVSRKVQGQLHQETHYGWIKDPYIAGKRSETSVIRVRIEDLSAKDVELIVDKAVREAVAKRLQGGDPSKVFKNGQNVPVLIAKSGKHTPIRRVRVRCGQMDLINLGPERRVMGGNNHHLEVFGVMVKGETTWQCNVVSMLEAMSRVRNGDPIVATATESGDPLVFSLVQNDTVELDWKGQRGLAKVMGVSKRDFTFRWISDARLKSELGEAFIRFTSAGALQSSGLKKLSIDPIGNFHETRD